jgi:NAD(P)-dependent dehydrogenase (short-subunit alcohol dehydrogenase family)
MSPTGVARLSRRLPGRRAFVTGAGSGFGRAFARQLAASGWTVGLFDLHESSLADTARVVEAAGGRAWTRVGDVSEQAQVEGAIGDFAAAEAGLDLLINNAGVAVAGHIEETPGEDWRWIVGINLLGVVYGCRAAVPILRARRGGVILNIASVAGFAAAPRMAAYNTTKAGVIALSETLAAELADAGVQVSVAMPGFVRTGLLGSLRAPPDSAALAHRYVDGARHDADTAAHAMLVAVAAGRHTIVWPAEYRWAWRLKRWLPGVFRRASVWLHRRVG